MSERPNLDELQKLAARGAEGPVCMLNLIRLKPEGGAESYSRYAAAVAPLLAKVGGELVYAGSGAELLIGTADDRWDLVLIVRYPTRQAFVEMTTSEEYRAVMQLREDSLVRSVLLATDPTGL